MWVQVELQQEQHQEQQKLEQQEVQQELEKDSHSIDVFNFCLCNFIYAFEIWFLLRFALLPHPKQNKLAANVAKCQLCSRVLNGQFN